LRINSDETYYLRFIDGELEASGRKRSMFITADGIREIRKPHHSFLQVEINQYKNLGFKLKGSKVESVEENGYACRQRINSGYTFVQYKVLVSQDNSKSPIWRTHIVRFGRGGIKLKRLLRRRKPFLMIFRVPSKTLKKIEVRQTLGVRSVRKVEKHTSTANNIGVSSSSSELQVRSKASYAPSFSLDFNDTRLEVDNSPPPPITIRYLKTPQGGNTSPNGQRRNQKYSAGDLIWIFHRKHWIQAVYEKEDPDRRKNILSKLLSGDSVTCHTAMTMKMVGKVPPREYPKKPWIIFYKDEQVNVVVEGITVNGLIVEDQQDEKHVRVKYLLPPKRTTVLSHSETDDGRNEREHDIEADSDSIWHVMTEKFWYMKNKEWYPAYEIIQEVNLAGGEKEYVLLKASESGMEGLGLNTVNGIASGEIRRTGNKPDIKNKICEDIFHTIHSNEFPKDIVDPDVRKLMDRSSQLLGLGFVEGAGFLLLKGKWVTCSIISVVESQKLVEIRTTEGKYMWVSCNLVKQQLEKPSEITLNGQAWSLFRVGEKVVVYKENTRVWQHGEVEAVGALGAVWVMLQGDELTSKKDRRVKVRSDSWKIHRDIPGEKMSFHVRVIKSNGTREKLKLTFDRWSTSFGKIRRMLAHKYQISRKKFKILLNKVVLENTANNDISVMSLLLPLGGHDGCCLEMKILENSLIERQCLQNSKLLISENTSNDMTVRQNYDDSSDSEDETSNTEIRPGEETFDSEQFMIIHEDDQ
jgi:hypothetical protein